jgi:hypothetical protein
MKAHLILFSLIIMNLMNISLEQFTQLDLFGEYINDITKDNRGRILATTYLGRIFRSSHNGKTWIKICNNTLKADLRSVIVNSEGCNNILKGTCGGSSISIYRITDNGANWEKLENWNENTSHISRLSNINGIICAATRGLGISNLSY